MSFKDLEIKNEYRSLIDSMAEDFYIPVLKEAVSYKRSAGFFSSTSLAHVTKGLCQFVKNGGHIQIVACPILSEEDVKAINDGYTKREEVIYDALLKQLTISEEYFESQRLNLLANMIADGFIDIKIAVTSNDNMLGIYHEKMGIMTDADGNIIAFSGSANATGTAMSLNYEAIDVYCDWDSDTEAAHAKAKLKAFESIWNNREPNIEVYHFPELDKEIITRFKREKANFEIDKQQYSQEIKPKSKVKSNGMPTLPNDIDLYDYQKEAILNWANNDFRGIFDMATGTGKTLTGLGAVVNISKYLENKLAVIIVCPYQHLVEQWVPDVESFGINPIVGYSTSSQKDWRQKLSKAIFNQRFLKDKPFFCFLTTNATFSSEFVQKEINKIKSPILLLVDEAHNFGSERLLSYLDERFTYRLALSATFERHHDEEGSKGLLEFFGEKCIEYDLERAIKESKLTPYEYYPVVVYLTEDELENYDALSLQISRNTIKGKNGQYKLNSYGEKLAIKRSRIVAGAIEKIQALKETITPYKHDNYILIYCGATNIIDENQDASSTDKADIKQIEAVTHMLGTELDMRVCKFTSEENIRERKNIIAHYKTGEDLQALVAIKCLDEGMNIPSVRTAFILASSTNPKEYIQRRGRVLRKADGKEKSIIYDFITLARPLEDVPNLTEQQARRERTLANNELRRIEEFSRIALNPGDSVDLIWDIREAYNITETVEEEYYNAD